MEKNSKSSKPVGVCNRIFRAFKGQTKPPKHPKPMELSQESSSHTTAPGKRKATRKTDLGSVMKDDRTNINVSMTRPAEHHPKVSFGNDMGAKNKDSVNDNDKFSDFISNAKKKIRTVSNVGGVVKRPGRTDSINDKALDYINRAKLRIRMTSTNFGNGIKGLTSK